MSLSLVPDLKHVLTPAFASMRLSWYEVPPGMNGMHANGLYSSSVELSSLNGRTSNRLSGMESSVFFCLLVWVYLLRYFFLGWEVEGGLPASPHSNSQSLKAGQRVSLTTYCSRATCFG